jgi:hypothetical protein
MTCTYPHGKPSQWCERHRIDHAFLVALRERERAAVAP